MATAARSPITWAHENRRIYAPGAFGERGGVVTLHANRNVELEASTSWARLMFDHLSMSRSREAEQLTKYFVTNVLRRFEILADPYGSTSGEDPFDYRSVPFTQARTVHAKLQWTGPILPTPFNDD
jgi:hypothetical protein